MPDFADVEAACLDAFGSSSVMVSGRVPSKLGDEDGVVFFQFVRHQQLRHLLEKLLPLFRYMLSSKVRGFSPSRNVLFSASQQLSVSISEETAFGEIGCSGFSTFFILVAIFNPWDSPFLALFWTNRLFFETGWLFWALFAFTVSSSSSC